MANIYFRRGVPCLQDAGQYCCTDGVPLTFMYEGFETVNVGHNGYCGVAEGVGLLQESKSKHKFHSTVISIFNHHFAWLVC